MNQAGTVARGGFKSSEDGRSKTEVRRARAQFMREHPIAFERTARGRSRFGLNERQRTSQPKKIEGSGLAEIRLGENGRIGELRHGLEGSAAGFLVVAALIGIMRVTGVFMRGGDVVVMMGRPM